MKDLNTCVENEAVTTEFDPAIAEIRFRVDPTLPIGEPPAVLNIIDENGREIPTFTSGSFSAITGKAKSKKTFFVVYLVSSFLGYVNNKAKGNPQDRPLTLWFDTEQSPYHLSQMVRRCCKLINDMNPANLKVYMLRTCTTDERIKLIDYTIKNNPSASLVVIDGIRDLVYDINSPEEATTTATRLMKWSAENDVHIINVLHQNKGDANARGHLGTEITNKAESIISVEVTEDPAISVVTAEYCRDIMFQPFSFTINDESLPELCDMPETRREAKRDSNPISIPDEKHFEALNKIYTKADELPVYSKLIDEIIGAFDISFGETKCRRFINHYLSKGWITKQRIGHKVVYKYERAIF